MSFFKSSWEVTWNERQCGKCLVISAKWSMARALSRAFSWLVCFHWIEWSDTTPAWVLNGDLPDSEWHRVVFSGIIYKMSLLPKSCFLNTIPFWPCPHTPLSGCNITLVTPTELTVTFHCSALQMLVPLTTTPFHPSSLISISLSTQRLTSRLGPSILRVLTPFSLPLPVAK